MEAAEIFATRLAVVSEASRAETKSLLRTSTKLARLWPGPASSLDAWMSEIDQAAVVLALHEDDYYREMSRRCLAKVAELEQGLPTATVPAQAPAVGSLAAAHQDQAAPSPFQAGPSAHSTLSRNFHVPSHSAHQPPQPCVPGMAWPLSLELAPHSMGGHSGRSDGRANAAGDAHNAPHPMAAPHVPMLRGGGQAGPAVQHSQTDHFASSREVSSTGQGATSATGGPSLAGGLSALATTSSSGACSGAPPAEGFRRHAYMLDPGQGAQAPPLMLNKAQSFRFMSDPILSPRSPRMCGGVPPPRSRSPPSLVINTHHMPASMDSSAQRQSASLPPTYLHRVTNLLYPNLVSTSPLGADQRAYLTARQPNHNAPPVGPDGGFPPPSPPLVPLGQLVLDGVGLPLGTPQPTDARQHTAGLKVPRDRLPNDDLGRECGPSRSRRLPQQTHATQNMMMHDLAYNVAMASVQALQQQAHADGSLQQPMQSPHLSSGLQGPLPGQQGRASPPPRFLSEFSSSSSSMPPGGAYDMQPHDMQQAPPVQHQPLHSTAHPP